MTEDLDANYARAYTGRLGFGQRPVLLVIDMVQAYFEPGSPLYADVDDTLASVLRLIEAARRSGVPVVYTNVVYHPSGRDGGMFFRKAPPLKCLTAGSPLAAWPTGIAPRADELVVSKQYPSAFFGTSLASTLHSGGIDTVLLNGVTTSGCVRASCVDTVSNGFIPIVVREACGDRHAAPHEANLFDMNAKYGDVDSEAEALDYLARCREGLHA